MYPPSPALIATLRALHGETDPHIVAPALDERQFARVLALAPGVDSVISALGALAGERPDFLAPDIRTSPALSAAVASLIGTNAGACVLPTWARVASTGWGVAHADALIDAVHDNRCPRWAAAALIGPTGNAAALLHKPWEMADAIRCWGLMTPDDPMAWMDALAPAERDRLLGDLRANHDSAAICLPWLPEANAVDVVDRITGLFLRFALTAYISASPIARTTHAAILSALMQRAEPGDLAELAHLAVASGMDAAWGEIIRILRVNPWNAVHVVAATPWDTLRADVQKIILSSANRDDVCAAIAYARGDRTVPPAITQKTARAFFAAVTPDVWTALPAETQQEWRDALDMAHTHLAVRSLGPDPAFLAGSYCSNELVAAVRRHLRNDAAIPQTLLPVVVRDLPIADLPAVVAALPPPSDPCAFVQIAGGSPTMPPALRAWITAHPTPQDMAAASTVLHAAERLAFDSVADRCAALAAALDGRTTGETDALIAALPDESRQALNLDLDSMTLMLARPNHHDAFRRALASLTALPPSVAIPVRHALSVLATNDDPTMRRSAREGLATAARDHSPLVLDILESCTSDVRAAMFPGAVEVRSLAASDPLVVHYLAYALQDGDADVALDALAAAPAEEMTRIWRLMPEALQSAVPGDRDALASAAAAPGGADALAQTLRACPADDTLPLLALRMLIEDDERRRARGAAILAQRPDLAAALLPLLRKDLHALLARDPRIVVAGADLPPPHDPAPVSTHTQRRRR